VKGKFLGTGHTLGFLLRYWKHILKTQTNQTGERKIFIFLFFLFLPLITAYVRCAPSPILGGVLGKSERSFLLGQFCLETHHIVHLVLIIGEGAVS
jgi:hypothetical protein